MNNLHLGTIYTTLYHLDTTSVIVERRIKRLINVPEYTVFRILVTLPHLIILPAFVRYKHARQRRHVRHNGSFDWKSTNSRTNHNILEGVSLPTPPREVIEHNQLSVRLIKRLYRTTPINIDYIRVNSKVVVTRGLSSHRGKERRFTRSTLSIDNTTFAALTLSTIYTVHFEPLAYFRRNLHKSLRPRQLNFRNLFISLCNIIEITLEPTHVSTKSNVCARRTVEYLLQTIIFWH